MQTPTFIIVDLFCGAGGTTTGFVMAGNEIAKVIACVNHDPKAIESHWKNHPEVHHFEEDIRTLNLTGLTEIVKTNRVKYPNAHLILWASLECTNFSNAKGGQPRDADSRTLADHLHRYVKAINPDYVQIENVVEFMSWGPLDENGKPISRDKGIDWVRWRGEMNAHGYWDDWVKLDSADFGAHTSRRRLFGCFARPYLPIFWPEPTHSKKHVEGREKWKAVKEVLDFSDEGLSIFNRKKDLSEKTLERIYAGLVKYVAKGDTSFLTKYYSGRPSNKVVSVDSPMSTLRTKDGQSLIQTEFLLKYNSTTSEGVHIPPSIENPCPVISCQGRLGLVQLQFLAAYYGNGANVSSIEKPCPVIPTKDRFQLVQAKYFIDKHCNSAQNQSIDQPAGTILTNDKHRLVEAVPFMMPTNFNNGPVSIDEPCQTITANRKHHYIVNPSHGGHSTSTERPCPVIIARQDKAPLYLIQAETGECSIPVYDTDPCVMIRIKEFMIIYGLVDIKMRMLRVLELLRIQGFPKDYVLCGNQSDQKKFIGNSVVPHVVKVWAEAMHWGLCDFKQITA